MDWDKLIGDRPYILVRRGSLHAGDEVYSSRFGPRTVFTTEQHDEGQAIEIHWTDTYADGTHLHERYPSDSLIPLLSLCGVENPDYPGEYACTYPRGHGKVSDEAADVRDMDHGSPKAGAWWNTPTEGQRIRQAFARTTKEDLEVVRAIIAQHPRIAATSGPQAAEHYTMMLEVAYLARTRAGRAESEGGKGVQRTD